MDLRPLIRATLRLVDLHDLKRSPGSSTMGVVEERPGLGDGIWIDVAARLLAYIRQNDNLLSREYVDLVGAFRDIREHYPELSTDDLEYVVRLLATPTHSRMRDPVASDVLDHTREEGALLDRPVHERARKARLTRTGRNAIKLSSTARSFLLTQFKAHEITHALRLSLFDDASDALHTVMQRIAEVAEDLRHALERPGRGEMVKIFSSQSKDYNAALRDTRIAIEDARRLIGTREVSDAMNQEAEATGGTTPDHFAKLLQTALNRLEYLGRAYSDFLSDVANAVTQPIGVKDMARLAHHLAFNPPSEELLAASHALIGPMAVYWPHPASQDFAGCLPGITESRAELSQPLERPETTSSQVSPMQLFLETYQAQIMALLTQRPVRLSEAREQGWLSAMGQQQADQLVGAFASPIWLHDHDDIAIRFLPGVLEMTFDNHRTLRGDDIELTLRKPSQTTGAIQQ